MATDWEEEFKIALREMARTGHWTSEWVVAAGKRSIPFFKENYHLDEETLLKIIDDVATEYPTETEIPPRA